MYIALKSDESGAHYSPRVCMGSIVVVN